METIRIGISACLLGHPVRYDGETRLDPFLVETWGRHFEYVPVCPETGMGLPVPREPSRLEGDPGQPRFVARQTRTDHTGRLERWGRERLGALERDDLDGFVFKSRSPSCGIRELAVYRDEEIISRTGAGVWARMVMERFPLLPVEDERRLFDPDIRDAFIERVFVYRRWRVFCAANPTPAGLIEFHARHKLILMAHRPSGYREMGKLAAQAGTADREGLFGTYGDMLMDVLKTRATVRKNVNVLDHVMGYFKRNCPPEEKRELLDAIARYREGELPLIVPVTLLNHYAGKYAQEYLRDQYYLNPHPLERLLRNHA